MIASHRVPLLLAALGLAGLTACGGGTVAPAPAAPSSGVAVPEVSVPAVSVPPVPGIGEPAPSSSSDGGTAATLPAGFPLPPGARQTGGTDDGREITAQVSLTDGASAVAFWEKALPGAGYTVASSEGAAGFQEIRISGRGFSADDSQIVVQGTTATVQLDRG